MSIVLRVTVTGTIDGATEEAPAFVLNNDASDPLFRVYEWTTTADLGIFPIDDWLRILELDNIQEVRVDDWMVLRSQLSPVGTASPMFLQQGTGAEEEVVDFATATAGVVTNVLVPTGHRLRATSDGGAGQIIVFVLSPVFTADQFVQLARPSAGGGGGAGSLAATLLVGNTTGGRPILVTLGDLIQGSDNTVNGFGPADPLTCRGGDNFGTTAGDDGGACTSRGGDAGLGGAGSFSVGGDYLARGGDLFGIGNQPGGNAIFRSGEGNMLSTCEVAAGTVHTGNPAGGLTCHGGDNDDTGASGPGLFRGGDCTGTGNDTGADATLRGGQASGISNSLRPGDAIVSGGKRVAGTTTGDSGGVIVETDKEASNIGGVGGPITFRMGEGQNAGGFTASNPILVDCGTTPNGSAPASNFDVRPGRNTTNPEERGAMNVRSTLGFVGTEAVGPETGGVQTTDGTVTVLARAKELLSNGQNVKIRCWITGIEDDGTANAVSVLVEQTFIRTGGVVTALTAHTSDTQSTGLAGATWNASLTISGNDINVTVEGTVGDTVNWAAQWEHQEGGFAF